MTPLVAPVLGVLAHVVHYTLVLGGAVVVVALLASSRPGRARPVTAHDRRVEQLRVAVAAGDLGAAPPPVTGEAPDVLRARTLALPGRDSTAIVVALISSAAAAGVHAAAGPIHFREGLLIGSFFVVSALAQLAWSMLLLTRGADRALLWAGLVGNAAIVVLWALTRTVGLPGLVEVEPVGSWDVAASAWELVIVGSCAVALSGEFVRGARGMLDMVRWSTASRAWLVGSVLVMVALTLTGAPA